MFRYNTIYPLTKGVKPEEFKDISNKQAIKVLEAQQIILNLNEDNKVFVVEGQKVKINQELATNVFSSISGEVISINKQQIIIQNDYQQQETKIDLDFQNLNKEEILEKVKQARVVGLGGSGFPTDIKLSTTDAIQTVIINAAECEPFITADDLLIREYTKEIIKGIEIIEFILKPKQVIIAIEDNKQEAIEKLQTHLQDKNYYLAIIPTIYPSGDSAQLIKILTNKEMQSGIRTSKQGFYMQNIATCKAIYDAVCLDKPLIERVITITGKNINNAGNYLIKVGTILQEILERTNNNNFTSFIIGGPMMGAKYDNLQRPIQATDNCILLLETEYIPELPCIRCASCEQVCPVNLLPQQLHFFTKTLNEKQLQRHNLFDCIECGACAFVCPSNIPLVQYYKYAKEQIKLENIKQEKAQYSQKRFEERQARLERLEKEKAQLRAKKLAEQQQKSENEPKDLNKELTIKISMTKVTLNKARKAFEASGNEDLKQQIDDLEIKLQDLEEQLANLKTN